MRTVLRQAPRDRHPGEHRPGALVCEPAARHPLIAVSGGRGDGVSGAGAGARLDEKSRGTPTDARVEATGAFTVFAGPKRWIQPDRREEARAAAVSEERLPRVAHAGPAGDGDLRAAGGEARPDAEVRLRSNQLRAKALPQRGRNGLNIESAFATLYFIFNAHSHL